MKRFNFRRRSLKAPRRAWPDEFHLSAQFATDFSGRAAIARVVTEAAAGAA